MLPADDLSACCAETIARVLASSSADECPTCGTVYLPPDNDVEPFDAPAPPPPQPCCALGDVLADVALALRWRREARTVVLGAHSPLAALQGRSSGASSDATTTSTGALWRLITQPNSKVGRGARAGFVDALVRYCAETSRPDEDEPDWQRARVASARLGRLSPGHRAALSALAARADPAVGWVTACLVVADACAPTDLRAAWTGVYRALDTAGRPRVDRTSPPPEVAARAWGETQLRAALVAWSATGA